jgi:hypothetical protein
MRQRLLTSGLQGLSFYPVIKELIVESQWHNWDRDNPDGYELPEGPDGCDPEDYVLGHPHSQQTADRMGDLWEVRVDRIADAKSVNHRKPWDYDICIFGPFHVLQSIDVFRSIQGGWIFVSARAKQWLEREDSEWLAFTPVLTDSTYRD